MPKRFKTLNAALTYLRPTSGGDDAAVPDAPAGTALKKYQDYRSGKVRLDYTRANSSLPGETKIISLRPFALDKESTVKVTTTVSTRSFGNIGEFGLTLANLKKAARLMPLTWKDSNQLAQSAEKPQALPLQPKPVKLPLDLTSLSRQLLVHSQ